MIHYINPLFNDRKEWNYDIVVVRLVIPGNIRSSKTSSCTSVSSLAKFSFKMACKPHHMITRISVIRKHTGHGNAVLTVIGCTNIFMNREMRCSDTKLKSGRMDWENRYAIYLHILCIMHLRTILSIPLLCTGVCMEGVQGTGNDSRVEDTIIWP